MTEDLTREFDGFITREGELVSIEDADNMFSILVRSTENTQEIVQQLREFAEECRDKGLFRSAPTPKSGTASRRLRHSFPLVFVWTDRQYRAAA